MIKRSRGRGGPAACLSGYSGLACALLAQAVRDAGSKNGQRADALAFLASEGAGAMLANLAGVLGLGLDGRDLGELCETLEGKQ